MDKHNISRIYYCIICGKVMKGDLKYCSTACRCGHKRICKVCGVEFLGMKSAVFHSRECKLEYGRRVSRQSAESNHDAIERTCGECGRLFKPEYGSKKRVFCSDECSRKKSKRIGKAMRRARKNGNGYERVDPIKILSRDKWTCQICGIKTPKELRGTIEDNAPEVDHIIPLAVGGPHVAYNLQCACRKCNYTKGDSVAGQLILFAGVEYNAESQKTNSASCS
jgi:hypothetical protein